MSKAGFLYAFLSLVFSFSINRAICGNLERIAQQPQIVLDDFSAYQDISVVHFDVPSNLASAVFKFTAKEVKTGGLGYCSPRDVSIYLKSGSIPLVHPDGATVRSKLLKNRRRYSTLNLTSEGDQYEKKIITPAAGDWYAIAFRSWTDPDSEKITQQGLGTTCSTILDAELLIEPVKTALVIDVTKVYTVHLSKSMETTTLQFLLPENQLVANVSLSSSCGNRCEIAVNVVAEDLLADVLMNNSKTSLSFRPYSGYFHYLSLRLLSGNSTNIAVSILDYPEKKRMTLNNIQLTRKSLPDLFLFDYEHLQENSTEPTPVNVTIDNLTTMSFRIGAVYDIGGTLSIGIKLLNKTENLVVIGCISLGAISNITGGGGCMRKDSTTMPDLWVNSTKPVIIHIPYPEPGIWHLSMKALSVKSDKCPCLEDCQVSGCESCDCLRETSARVETSIGSSPCIEGGCNSNGHCHHYLDSGGFIITSCHCTGGYRGFDCSDDTYVLTGSTIQVRLLLLTLSNLAFMGSIYVAFRREYYTEAIVYAAVMFFSTFYHACEAGEDVYSVCIMKVSVLQFCDFYNALLSIWVTLVAMGSFGPRFTAFCQMSGAIVLALGAEVDRTALWVFLLPAITGCILVGLAWGMQCRRQRNFQYPGSRYKNVFLPTGLALVLVGLICYAFLQTRRNYHILHSFWHICSAVGIMLLLPKRKYMK